MSYAKQRWICLAFIALIGASPATQPTTQPRDVAGLVTDTDGRPIANAEVAWVEFDKDNPQYRDSMGRPFRDASVTHTASDGRFMLRGVMFSQPWGMHIRAVAEGKAAVAISVLPDQHDASRIRFADVNMNHYRDEPWLVLPAGHTLHGIVVDTDGKPVAGALVGGALGLPAATSDDQGHFALEHVVTLSEASLRGTDRTLKVTHPDFVGEWFREAGESSDNVRLTVHKGVLIEGRVSEFGTGKPLRATMYARTMPGPIDSTYTACDEDGVFKLRSFAGGIRLSCFYNRSASNDRDFDGRQWVATEPSKSIEAKDGDQITKVDFEFRPSLEVTGIVRTIDGTPPPAPVDVDVSLRDASGKYGGMSARAATAADGSFKLSKLASGDYSVTVSARDESHTAVGGQQFTIDDWEDFHGVEIVLSGEPEVQAALAASAERAAKTATPTTAPREPLVLRGRVIDGSGKPVPLGHVLAFDPESGRDEPLPESRPPEIYSRTELDGTFEMRLMSDAGPRVIFAWDSQRRYACTRRIEPGWSSQRQELQLTVATSRISGTVRDAQGKPQAGIPVELACRQEYQMDRGKGITNHTLLRAITDESGRYELVGYIAPPEGVPLRLTMQRRASEQYGVNELRHYGITEDEWYGVFPVEPGAILADMDFAYEQVEPGKVRQRVVREDLAVKRERDR